jgi:hypothetical protein
MKSQTKAQLAQSLLEAQRRIASLEAQASKPNEQQASRRVVVRGISSFVPP